jgi:hypothetical protein
MALLLCPRCDIAITVEDLPPRRCERCGTFLRRCRYCVHFDLHHLACVHPETLWPERVVDPDEARECHNYKFRPLDTGRPRTYAGMSALTWTLICILVITSVLLYIGIEKYTYVGPTETLLQLQLRAGGTVLGDEPFDLFFGVYNRGKNPAHRVILFLGPRTFEAMDLIDADPLPLEVLQKQGGLLLDYGDLGKGKSLLGRLTLRPVHSGHHMIKATISADNSARPQTVETYVRIGKAM